MDKKGRKNSLCNTSPLTLNPQIYCTALRNTHITLLVFGLTSRPSTTCIKSLSSRKGARCWCRNWLMYCATIQVRGFDSRCCHWNFSLAQSFLPHRGPGPGVDSSSNGNEYREYLLGVKRRPVLGLTILPPSCADCLEIWEPQLPGILRACSGLYRGCFTFTFTFERKPFSSLCINAFIITCYSMV